MPSPETENAKRKGGRPHRTRQETRRFYEEIYRLYLTGLRETQIAEQMHVSPSTVSEAINSIRKGDTWFDKSARQRFGDIIDRGRDMILSTISESIQELRAPELADKPAVRAIWMARAQAGMKMFTELAPEADMLRIEEAMDKLKAQQDKLLEIEQGKKVQPIGVLRFENTP